MAEINTRLLDYSILATEYEGQMFHSNTYRLTGAEAGVSHDNLDEY